MKLQFIVCEVMKKEAYFCVARSKNTIDVVLIPQSFHDTQNNLFTAIQDKLNNTCNNQGIAYDASVLGYGLCSNGIVGLGAEIPFVVPHAHDCITLLLGSRKKYQQHFDEHSRTYWYSPGWIDAGNQPGKQRYERTVKEYEQKYGKNKAQYLMGIEQEWINQYNCAAYIDWGFDDSEKYKKYTKQCAEFLGWNYKEVKGSSSLIQKLLDGDWNESEFLMVKPGQRIAEDLTGQGIIKAERKECLFNLT